MAGSPPKLSMFPEMDFASKVAEQLGDELARLSNATSREIRKGLARCKFYIRVPEAAVDLEEGLRPVTSVPENGSSRLSHRSIEDVSLGSRQEGFYQRHSRTSYQ